MGLYGIAIPTISHTNSQGNDDRVGAGFGVPERGGECTECSCIPHTL